MEPSTSGSIFDIKSRNFDVDAYISAQLKRKTLDELIKNEEEMVTSVRRLDSDVHQIVYENYNKFLTATNTVRKIQDEFSGLETGMSEIGSSMGKIQSLIGDLGGVLGRQHTDIAQLARSYRAVKSVQFIFHLPVTLQNYLDERKFATLIRIYLLAKSSLTAYSDLDKVSSVLNKCESIVKEAEGELRLLITSGQIDNTEEIVQAVELLEKLGVSKDDLQVDFLIAAQKCLKNDLVGLETKVEDVLDLVDRGCGTFLPNLTLFVDLHNRLFPETSQELLECVQELLTEFHAIVKRLFLSSGDPKDCSIVVRALDRYYRKMNACSQVLTSLNFSDDCIVLINEVSRHQMKISRIKIVDQLESAFQELRELVLSDGVDLSSCFPRLEQLLVFNVKTSLANLLLFTASDVTFSAIPASLFQNNFAISVHEDLLVGALIDVAEAVKKYSGASNETRFISPLVLLVIGVFLHHIAVKSTHYLMRLCEEQFLLVEKKNKKLTSVETVVGKLREAAQEVMKRFVDHKGLSCGESLAKAVESSSQLSTTPVGVRSAVRRVVDEIRELDTLLAQMLNDGKRELKSARVPRATIDTFQRDTLWSERVDFHDIIHFNRGSIISGVVKMFLKIFIEAVRAQTFGKHAIEQVQVDCYYLQRNLAPLVADEVIVNSLTDAALSSALKRSLDPVLLHPNKLMQLCEQSQQT
ncbi:unnamed protein product, partial [Mesorhabditis belari]|uniref:Vacuolar protein sorting-associated protein 51 homolog n=1 Tax=Mesorhabditis belari TaxID=2138241 RepID=A0AAF3J312_9BILA